MFKKWGLSIMAVSLVTGTLAFAQSDQSEEEVLEQAAEETVSSIAYQSSQFTKPTPEKTEQPVQSNLGKPFDKMAENDALALYVDPATLGIKVQNKKTGYIWSSTLDQPENFRLNNTWQQFVQSGVTIEYVDQRGNVKTESILTNSSQVMVTPAENGFTALILFVGSNVEMTVNVTLTDTGIDVHVPEDEVDEGKRNRLTSVQLFPFFGASFDKEREGYFFLPEGPGALVRFGKESQYSNSAMIGAFYGEDPGLQTGSAVKADFSAPVFGIVHGTKENAIFTEIKEGQHYADLRVQTPGVSTDFYWMTPSFHYRSSYFQPTSRAMDGVNVFQEERNAFSIRYQVTLLHGDEATYSGMARSYQQSLLDEGRLIDREDRYAMRLDYLGAEEKPGLLWDSVIAMTTAEDVEKHVAALSKEDVESLLVGYRGWSKGGYSNNLPASFPAESAVGGESGMVELQSFLEKREIPLYVTNTFSEVTKGSRLDNGSKEVARQPNAQLHRYSETERLDEAYLLKPGSAAALAEEWLDELAAEGLNHASLGTTGAYLYGDFDSENPLTRSEAVEVYEALYQAADKKTAEPAYAKPNDYGWQYAHHYFDAPMYSSNYMMTTETVPFIPMVLKGILPMYSPYLNLQPDEQQDRLRMIEYGMYPSYLLTEKSPAELSDTASNYIVTSEISVWNEAIVKTNQQVGSVLKQVEDATIINHEAVQPGVVVVTYGNDVQIAINYTKEMIVINDSEVVAASAAVLGDPGEGAEQ